MKEQQIIKEKSKFSRKLTAVLWLPTKKYNKRTLKTQRGKYLL